MAVDFNSDMVKELNYFAAPPPTGMAVDGIYSDCPATTREYINAMCGPPLARALHHGRWRFASRTSSGTGFARRLYDAGCHARSGTASYRPHAGRCPGAPAIVVAFAGDTNADA